MLLVADVGVNFNRNHQVFGNWKMKRMGARSQQRRVVDISVFENFKVKIYSEIYFKLRSRISLFHLLT